MWVFNTRCIIIPGTQKIYLEAINEGFATTDVLKTTATWYGVTYKEDTLNVKNSLKKLVEDKEYPSDLWNE